MGLFRRRRRRQHRPEDADARPVAAGQGRRTASTSADPPGWDGEARGEPGIHGVPRARRWDAVVHASAPGLAGSAVRFVALAGGRLVVDGDEDAAAVAPLAAAAEGAVPEPYRAEAVRQDSEGWAVAVCRIDVVEEPALDGATAELVVNRAGRALHVDGRPSFRPVPALERAGQAQGSEYVVRATRLDGALWEVEATPL